MAKLIRPFQDLVTLFYYLLALITKQEVGSDPNTGAQKKAAVLATVKQLIKDTVHVNLPPFIPEASVDYFLGFVIDAIVAMLNKSTFFAPGSTLSPAPAVEPSKPMTPPTP